MTTALTPTFNVQDYVKFFASGALCCTITHGMLTPVDVVKTRIQIDNSMKGFGLVRGMKHVVATEGAKGLLTGFGPTAVGYLIQGGAKFSGYEFWKKTYVDLVGPENAAAKRTAIYLGASSTAEFFADILLTPLEATRIRLVSDRSFASGLATGFTKILRLEGLGGLYAGFIPICFKQIPYTVGQFTTNEFLHELVNKQIDPATRKKFSKAQETGVTFLCGAGAGVVASVVSHPADTLLSKINQGGGGSGSTFARLGRLAAEAGPSGLFAGLGPRTVMTTIMVCGQFLIYDGIKSLLGAPKGIEIHKVAAE